MPLPMQGPPQGRCSARRRQRPGRPAGRCPPAGRRRHVHGVLRFGARHRHVRWQRSGVGPLPRRRGSSAGRWRAGAGCPQVVGLRRRHGGSIAKKCAGSYGYKPPSFCTGVGLCLSTTEYEPSSIPIPRTNGLATLTKNAAVCSCCATGSAWSRTKVQQRYVNDLANQRCSWAPSTCPHP